MMKDLSNVSGVKDSNNGGCEIWEKETRNGDGKINGSGTSLKVGKTKTPGKGPVKQDYTGKVGIPCVTNSLKQTSPSISQTSTKTVRRSGRKHRRLWERMEGGPEKLAFMGNPNSTESEKKGILREDRKGYSRLKRVGPPLGFAQQSLKLENHADQFKVAEVVLKGGR